jgi:hypothetical protein
MERYELHGVKVYQLNICEAIDDHHLCPGITTLKAGDHELGTVAGNCPCHKKDGNERPQPESGAGVSVRHQRGVADPVVRQKKGPIQLRKRPAPGYFGQ